MIIAVDGPAASGKGTIARALAAHFGLPHMDTGLLYRATAKNLLEMGGDPESEFAAARATDLSQIDFDDPELKSETVGNVASRSNDVFTRSLASRRASAFPGSSSPTTDSNEVWAPSAAALRATFAAPPGRSSVRAIFTTGTGASGEMRSTSPNQ